MISRDNQKNKAARFSTLLVVLELYGLGLFSTLGCHGTIHGKVSELFFIIKLSMLEIKTNNRKPNNISQSIYSNHHKSDDQHFQSQWEEIY